MSGPRLICLDAFGTIARIGERRDPYGRLFAALGVGMLTGRHLALTRDVDLPQLARLLVPGHTIDLTPYLEDLQAEVASVALYGDTLPALERLRRAGHRLWVGSNLARPYGQPLRSLLADHVDGFCFSYVVGVVKPDRAFFERMCADAGEAPEAALMVGDSLKADVRGATASGMRAVHLLRHGAGAADLRSLTDLVERHDLHSR